jgi:3'(2'), 5'-bisphosphate nucleotidase
MNSETLQQICAIARQVSWGAADILRAYYRGEMTNEKLATDEAKDGPVTKADLAANRYILDELQAQLAPLNLDFGYLSEETHQNDEVIAGEYVWIIDPLDGTRDFIEKTGEYAIHLALTHQQRPILAVVTIPEQEIIYFATQGGGTYKEHRQGDTIKITPSHRNTPTDLILVASPSHRDDRFKQLIEDLPFKDTKYVGSVGCKIATILEQQCDVYISLSGKSAPKDWDFAAPEFVLIEAGGAVSSFEQTPLIYNQGDVRKWGGIMASNGQCHQELCELATNLLAQIDGQSA